jgi:hypothetical protein
MRFATVFLSTLVAVAVAAPVPSEEVAQVSSSVYTTPISLVYITDHGSTVEGVDTVNVDQVDDQYYPRGNY